MKKFLGIVLCGLFAVALTGCGCSKSESYDLECTNSSTESGYKYETFIGVNFDGDKVTDMTMKMTFEDEKTAKTMYDLIKDSDTAEYKLDGKTISATQTPTGDDATG